MTLIDKIKELKKIYDPDEIYIEKEKYSVTIADTIDHHKIDLNFSFVEHENKSKGDRIHRLKQWFENKRILLGQVKTTWRIRLLSILTARTRIF